MTTRPRVLLVEDYADSREMYALYLEKQGFEVFQGADGLTGLALAGVQAIDVAVLDVGLPQLDGLELTRRLRARTETATLPIVILTAHTGPPARELALAAGANLVLTKPCLPDEVARAIRKLLDSPTPRVPPQSAAG